VGGGGRGQGRLRVGSGGQVARRPGGQVARRPGAARGGGPLAQVPRLRDAFSVVPYTVGSSRSGWAPPQPGGQVARWADGQVARWADGKVARWSGGQMPWWAPAGVTVQCPAPAGGSARRGAGGGAAEEAVLWGRQADASCEESPSLDWKIHLGLTPYRLTLV
jgi:hypothetical protein